MASRICTRLAVLLLSVALAESFTSRSFQRQISRRNAMKGSQSTIKYCPLHMSAQKSRAGEADDEDDESNTDDKGGFLIKEIEGEDNQKTGQFIVNKKVGDGDLVPLFAFSAPPAPLSDSLIVVGATMGGLLSMVLVFLFSNKDIVPFTN